jgi:Transposase DDE domain
MTTIPEASRIIQDLLHEKANKLAKTTGFIQRERQLTGAGFAQTLILGGLDQPDATAKQLHHQAIRAGMELSVQALDQRFTEEAGQFMQALLSATLTCIVQSEAKQVILPFFNGIYITDCTRLPWVHNPMKLGLRFELQHGLMEMCLIDIEKNDQKAEVVDRELPARALHLADLGFFKLNRFARMSKRGVYWLTRYKVGTRLRTLDGKEIDLKTLLTGTDEVNLPVLVGAGHSPLKAQLVAKPLPNEALEKRQERLKEQVRLDQRPLSPAQEEIMTWTLYLTNIPNLTFEHAFILARIRWQIELIFKLWKSNGAILRSRSANPMRQFCEGIGKLIGVIIAHWSLLVAGWEIDRISPLDALRILRAHVPFLQSALIFHSSITDFFWHLIWEVNGAARIRRRKKTPLAFQLWYYLEKSFP